eukprot:CAMPEP_0176440484 /NCGR_PEP_ID=MMETSP0127-20121128/20600_1 /TAXON_ID=938130 /ORGANISM="Platyophrya macrostoma, Strain WH" /LENGTH=464 /DNA_ID=CAMNT_0017825021 /DNA_START=75 /DNA_END=1472 /DNA_ORIENTATION=+
MKAGEAHLENLEHLLTSLSNLKIPDALIKEVRQWEASSEAPKNHLYKKVYDLLIGNHKTYQEMNWIRKLGIRLWFTEKPQHAFEVIFGKFNENEAKLSEDILSSWNHDSIDTKIKNSKFLDLIYILMCCFCKPDGKFLYQNLNTYSRSHDVLDTKHIWIIYEYLKQNVAQFSGNLGKEEKSFRYRILRSFAYQLELVGLWEYAVYLYVIASKDTFEAKKDKNILQIRNKIIREIIHRNYNIIGKKRCKGSKMFLEKTFQLPAEWLIEAKAFKHLTTLRYEKAAKNFLKSKHYQAAYNILSQIVAPRVASGEIYGEEARRLQNQLNEIKKHSAVKWSNEGETIQLFLEIRALFEKKNDQSWKLEIEHLLEQISKMQKIIVEATNEDTKDKSRNNFLRRRSDLENIMLAKITTELFKIALEEMNHYSFLKHKKWFKNYMQLMPTEFKEANHASYLKMIELYCSTYP